MLPMNKRKIKKRNMFLLHIWCDVDTEEARSDSKTLESTVQCWTGSKVYDLFWTYYDIRQVAVYLIEVDYLHPCFDFLCNSMVECWLLTSRSFWIGLLLILFPRKRSWQYCEIDWSWVSVLQESVLSRIGKILTVFSIVRERECNFVW